MNLDQETDVTEEEGKTLRERGSIIVINLEYHNINGSDEFEYHYKAKRVPKTQFKTETYDDKENLARTR